MTVNNASEDQSTTSSLSPERSCGEMRIIEAYETNYDEGSVHSIYESCEVNTPTIKIVIYKVFGR